MMMKKENEGEERAEEEKGPVEHEEEIQKGVDKFAKKADAESDNPDFATREYYRGFSDLLYVMWGVDASSEFAKRISILRSEGKLRDGGN